MLGGQGISSVNSDATLEEEGQKRPLVAAGGLHHHKGRSKLCFKSLHEGRKACAAIGKAQRLCGSAVHGRIKMLFAHVDADKMRIIHASLAASDCVRA